MKKNNHYGYYEVANVKNLKELLVHAADAFSDQAAFMFDKDGKYIEFLGDFGYATMDMIEAKYFNTSESDTTSSLILSPMPSASRRTT